LGASQNQHANSACGHKKEVNQMRKSYILLILIIILSFSISALVKDSMLPYMASHWNYKGEADGYMPRLEALFFLPIVSIFIFFLLAIIPKLDPLYKNIEDFRSHYDIFVVLMVSFFFYIHLLTIFWNLLIPINMNQMISPAVAILTFYMGILVYNSKRNWSIGIRTSWALSSDYVWEKTHKFGGRLFTAAGIFCLLGVIFPDYAVLFILVPILLASLTSVLYSYIIFQEYKHPKKKAKKQPKTTFGQTLSIWLAKLLFRNKPKRKR
jgi:uncharacterized membrane protein